MGISQKRMKSSRILEKTLPLTFWTRIFDTLTEILKNENSVRSRYLLDHIISKLRDPRVSTAESRQSAAIDKWLKTEERNQRTNVRLLTNNTHFSFGCCSDRLLSDAASLIRTIIGDEVPNLESLYSFSDGASTSTRRGIGSIGVKFQSGGHVTSTAHRIFTTSGDSLIWKELRNWSEPTIVEGNVLFTVPKSSTIDRCAAKEPDLNMFLQKGVGSFIRTRLRERARIDLNDQTINQRLAYQGSIDGQLATIDLSSASDSVTCMLVRRLLPVDWYCYLDNIRSQRTFVRGGWHDNEMFSSMGNAFTFELESLIFWALAKTLRKHLRISGKISVYGDDIICPVSMVKPLIQVLGFCGFMVNQSKSFWTGGIRESCGKHYYRGKDITPFYVREIPTTLPHLLHLANRLRQWLERGDCVGGFLDSDYYSVWKEIAAQIPRPLHGGYDTERVDWLVSYGTRPFALLKRKASPDWWFQSIGDPKDMTSRRILKGGKRTAEVSTGLYLHWLCTSQEVDRCQQEVSNLMVDRGYTMKRVTRDRHFAFAEPVLPFIEEMNGN